MSYQHSINQVKGFLFFQSLFGNRGLTYNADNVRENDVYGQGREEHSDTLNLDHSRPQEPDTIMFDMRSGTYLEVGQDGRKNYLNLTGFERTISSEDNGARMNIMGTESSNRIETGRGDDYIQGRGGHDYLNGRAGDDLLIGGSGDDWLRGGEGVDIVYGGSGRDTFVMTEGDGYDIIKDFVDGVDTLWIQSAGDLTIHNLGSNGYVFRDDDLMAVVIGAADDLQIGDGGITVI